MAVVNRAMARHQVMESSKATDILVGMGKARIKVVDSTARSKLVATGVNSSRVKDRVMEGVAQSITVDVECTHQEEIDLLATNGAERTRVYNHKT